MPTTPSPARIKATVISLTASLVVAALFIRAAAARKAARAESEQR
jgi:hypothetical protein